MGTVRNARVNQGGPRCAGIVGLGLIGGSFARGYAQAGVRVLAWDPDEDVMVAASMGTVSGELNDETLGECDIIVLACYPEACIEWHAWYQNEENELWQMDMIHIREGSRYDGYFEKVAQRISEIMTDEIRETILRLKYETPETEKIIGVEYYQAVIRDGVRDYSGFKEWRKQHPVTGVVEWMP